MVSGREATDGLGKDAADTAEATGAPRNGANRRFAWLLLRLGLSLALLMLLFRKIALSDLLELFAHGIERWPLLLLGYGLPILGVLFAALRWRILLRVQDIRTRLRTLIEGVLVGTCFNQVLPSTIGGDVARSLWVTKPGDPVVISLTVVTVDRAIGVLGLGLLAMLGAIASPSIGDLLPAFWIVALLAIGVGVLATFMFRQGNAFASWLFSTSVLKRYREKARIAYQSIAAYRGHGLYLSAAACFSVGLQLLIVLQYVAFAQALGVQASKWDLALIVPIVTLISLVPVTINGLGLREGAFAFLGVSFGLRVGDAIALGVMFMTATLLYSIVGAVIHLRGRSL